jgi:threonine dehydratase
LTLAKQLGATVVHPFDDLDVIAGQGTIALEMLAAEPSLDTLCISVGGGGLIGGIATAAKALKPDIAVMGVQTERFPAMVAHFRGQTLESAASSIAEGIAVKEPGVLTKSLVSSHVDDMLLVTEEAIEEAILMLLEIEKTVVEGAGAAGLAAVLKHRARFAGRRVGLVLCGGNIDPLLLAEIIQRGLARSQRLTRISVATRDVPGALSRVATIISAQGANIEEVAHQRTFSVVAAGHVSIDFVLATRDAAHVQLVLAALRAAGLEAALR